MNWTTLALDLRGGAAIAAWLWTAPCPALADPTRAPEAWRRAQGTDSATAQVAPAARATIILRGRERQVAVVDGQTVRRGDRLGEQRVVRIDPYRLILSNGDTVELSTSTLTPPNPNPKRP